MRPRPGAKSDKASSMLVLPLPFWPVRTDIEAAGSQTQRR